MPDIHQINTVIFDLGGVIIGLNEIDSYRAFAELSGKSLEEVQEMAAKVDFFRQYEVGEIDDPTFRAEIREALQVNLSDLAIDSAWNAMLKEVTRERLQKIEQMADRFQIFVMSNTNDIHIRQFLKIVEAVSPGKSFFDYFKQVYFSQEIGERKPNLGAWQVILDDHQIDPQKTLFIDDKQENLDGAAKLGIQGFLNTQTDNWIQLF